MSHGLILKIDDRTERLLRARARQDGVSLEEEAHKLLDRALGSDRDSFWERVDRVQQSLTGQSFPDSAELIREDRDR
jgi:plasmid stability protein